MVRVQEVLAGRYELLEVLGRGGMGVVYLAQDRVLDRSVAVKLLPFEYAEDPTVITRFQREARAAAALSHPNVVAVFDAGEDGDTRFIAMEYVPGESLGQLLSRRGRLPTREAVQIAGQIARALAAAHRAGIVHRDIKPANVMVNDGTVKVLDFGIARAGDSTSLTHTASVLGSAPYMAPELARGERADARSDVYALGCVLYEMLTGRPPFTGELAAAVLHQHGAAAPRAVAELSPDVPAGLSTLVMQMLAKDPAGRPQSAAGLVQSLTASLDARTLTPAPAARHFAATAPTKVIRRPPRLGRAQRRALSLVIALLMVGLLVVLLQPSGPASKHAGTHALKSAGSHAAGSTRRATVGHRASQPRTVAGAADALMSLATRELQAGAIDQRAAQVILDRGQHILSDYGRGHVSAALEHLTKLSAEIGQLSANGDITGAALPQINAAVFSLRSLLMRTMPTVASGPAPPPDPAPKPPSVKHGPAPGPDRGPASKGHGHGPKPPSPGHSH